MTKDLTTGNPMRLILQFSIPLVFGNLFQQMYNMIDTIIVGRYLGLSALTSVGSTASIIFLIIGFCQGTCSGLSIPVAQQFGAKNYDKMRMFIMNAAYLSIFLAAVLTVVTCLLCDNILTGMSTPQEFFQGAYDYLFVIFLGIPFTFLYNVVSGIIRAMGDSKTPFYFLVLSTVINIFLDLLFIIVFQWGTAGAGWATILAQGVSGILCFFFMKHKYEILKFSRMERKLRLHYIKILFVMGVPMGLQYSITAIGSIMLQSAVNLLGAVYVSAYTTALKIKQLAMCPYDAFATASATFGSQNLGAGQLNRIREGLKSGIFAAVIYSIGIGIVLIFAGSKIALLFVSASETEVLDMIQRFLTCAGFFYFFLAFLNCTRMTIQGLGYSAIAMLAGCSELIARGVMSLFVIPTFGFVAVCFTDQTAWIAATAVVVPVFQIIMKRLERQQKQHAQG
jgi:putative MATE family efflux protein